MIATVAETPTRISEPMNEREASRRDSDGGAIAGGAHVVAFDLVLDVAKGALEARARQSGSGSTAPAQMFEPIEPDAHGQRQAALRADGQREAVMTGAERFDRTSVEVRRDSVAGADGGASSSSSTTVTAKHTTALAGSDAPARAILVQPGMTDTGSVGRDAAHRSDALDPGAVREARTTTTMESQTAVEVSRESLAGAAGAVKVSAAAQQPSSTSGSDGVAAKVGQALGASRGGGSESARAPQAADPAPDGRTQAQTQRRASGSTQSERSSPERPSQRAEGGERPRLFDELVRSIRLRTGSYRSSAKMQLNPPELGRVSIDVRMEGERLHVDVRTEHAEAAKLLHGRAAQLRTALAEHGIIVERFDVAPETSEQGDGFTGPDGSSGGFSEWGAAHRHAVSSEAPGVDGARDGGQGDRGPELDHVVTVAERRLDVRI